MNHLDEEWISFSNSTINEMQLLDNSKNPKIIPKPSMPECSDIYISTKTRTCELNSHIDLYKIFWKLNVIKYHNPIEGIIKKSMKVNCTTEEETQALDDNLVEYKEPNMLVNVISYINSVKGDVKKYKDIRKVDMGLCKKDLISFKKKKKGAFYNCFALILRIKYKDKFKEVHVKIFNTGKLEIPGVQFDDLLEITLNKVVKILKPFTNPELIYKKDKIDTVLINSNFRCGFYLNRELLYDILKNKYRINCSYDSCSYPGIQCEFYYDSSITDQTGQQPEDKDKQVTKVSFMIFRTGSALIVGKCTEEILNIIYKFLCKLLIEEYSDISCGINNKNASTERNTQRKVNKKKIIVTI